MANRFEQRLGRLWVIRKKGKSPNTGAADLGSIPPTPCNWTPPLFLPTLRWNWQRCRENSPRHLRFQSFRSDSYFPDDAWPLQCPPQFAQARRVGTALAGGESHRIQAPDIRKARRVDTIFANRVTAVLPQSQRICVGPTGLRIRGGQATGDSRPRQGLCRPFGPFTWQRRASGTGASAISAPLRFKFLDFGRHSPNANSCLNMIESRCLNLSQSRKAAKTQRRKGGNQEVIDPLPLKFT